MLIHLNSDGAKDPVKAVSGQSNNWQAAGKFQPNLSSYTGI
jgi:hypothetical protein